MLETDPAKICFVILKAREIHAKVEVENPTEPETREVASDAVDDGFRAILEDYASDATYQELKDVLDGLNQDERVEILALTWLGRGDYALDDWEQALSDAADSANESETDYLIGTPLIADYLEEALDQMGYSCDDYEPGRL
ncbi:MAG TPA: DUF3775 domain-containing protein [Alphaproteobacteria bacterium]|nr:DUF3775 domain-containing protein [Alphaproteobacteria bacterium]